MRQPFRLLLSATCAILAFGVVLTLKAAGAAPVPAPLLAATPPMGWNSWDAYGFTIDEAQFRANVEVLAGLKPLGWTYAVIDEGWYMGNPQGGKREERDYRLDGDGLLVPVPSRFPSAANGAGFKPLADWVHALGLKFGLHIVRGIPRQAVTENLPVDGPDGKPTAFHAADAADTRDTCPWDDGTYGVRDNAAGQAYYDSMLRLYAAWGVDFLKVDCIADHPYKPTEIRQIAEAIRKTGRPIVLSLSPGPTALSLASRVAARAQMWRVSNDIWDGWRFPGDGKPDGFPNGVATAFDTLARWAPHTRPGAWPDADMLPIGTLAPHPGWGDPRHSRLSADEARTQFTLWAFARSPLILGANLTDLDAATNALIHNAAIIAIDQTATASGPLAHPPASFGPVRVWWAVAGANHAHYLGFFNTGDTPATVTANWADLGVPDRKGNGDCKAHGAHELWTGAVLAPASQATLTLAPHATAAYRLD